MTGASGQLNWRAITAGFIIATVLSGLAMAFLD